MKKTVILAILITTFINADFSRDTNGIVTDNNTKLKWQDSYKDNSIASKHWKDALNYCNTLTLGGLKWRLPNINELKTLIVDKESKPLIDNAFKWTKSSFYWSSTTKASDSRESWCINFSSGGIWSANNGSTYYERLVRCVSSGK